MPGRVSRIQGQAPPRLGEEPATEVKVVTHDYFRALRIPLLRGRLFDRRDTAPNTRRVIVSQAIVEKYFGNRDPIGQRVVLSWNDKGPDEIVGVVGDVRSEALNKSGGATYLPPGRFAPPYMSVAVKTARGDLSIAPSVVNAVREIDPDVPVSEIRMMAEVIAVSTAQRRFTMALLIVFSGVALVLASVGIYGVISYSVTQRTQEIGIRMALGAQHRDVVRMIVGNAMILTAIGIAFGAVGAFTLTRLMTTLLFNVTPQDPVTFMAVALLLAAVASIAAYLPGRRATRLDPVVALRTE